MIYLTISLYIIGSLMARLLQQSINPSPQNYIGKVLLIIGWPILIPVVLLVGFIT
jgi:hypothetical protein